MRLIDADALPREKMLAARGNGQYEDVDIVYGDDIDNAPTVIHLCEVCKHRHNTWDSETCDGCTGRECNFNPIDPVRHGEWIATEDPWFRACSVCGYPEWMGLWNNYCPECGSKMDGGTDNETD